MKQLTEVEIEVVVYASVRCPACGRRLAKNVRLTPEQIATTHREILGSAIDSARSEIQAAAEERGWRDRCGRCLDPDTDTVTGETAPCGPGRLCECPNCRAYRGLPASR